MTSLLIVVACMALDAVLVLLVLWLTEMSPRARWTARDELRLARWARGSPD